MDKEDESRVPHATISYETFVHDLDQGDSFTTCLLETLVKVSRYQSSRA